MDGQVSEISGCFWKRRERETDHHKPTVYTDAGLSDDSLHMTVLLTELRADGRQPTGVNVSSNDPTTECYLTGTGIELTELVYSGNTQLHGFNDPPLPVSVQGATSH